MEILKRVFVRTPSIPERLDTNEPWLVVTDCLAVRDWAVACAMEVVLVPAGGLGQEGLLQAIAARIEPRPACTVVMAVGFDEAIAAQDFAHVARYAQAVLALIARLMALRTRLSVIGMRRPEAVSASVLDGLALAARHETTRLRYSPVIVEGALDQRLRGALASCLASDGVRHWVKNGDLMREVLQPQPESDESVTLLKKRGCYVITGGAGGVGTLLAQYLVREWEANVCVMGRSPMTDALSARLKSAGARAYAQADVAQAQEAEAAMAQFQQRFGALDGVFHLAGVTDDRLVINKTGAELCRVLSPKIAGALNLWRLPAALRPGFVCGFSSLTSLVGNMGQADYAAANAFVDAFVEHAAHADAAGATRWHSINWGLWASDGMQMTDTGGLLPLDPAEACAALPRLISAKQAISVVFAGDSRVLGELAPRVQTVQPFAESPGTEAPAQTGRALKAWIANLVYKFTRLRDLPADESLIEAGVESATLISLVSAIENRLNSVDDRVRLSKAMVFDYPSIQALSDHLFERHPLAIISAFAGESMAPAGSTPSAAASPPTGAPNGLETAARSWLRGLVHRFTGLVDVADDANLVQLGMDSIASISLSSEIERQLSGGAANVRISRSLVFQHPSIAQVASHLIETQPVALDAMVAGASATSPERVPSAPVPSSAEASPTLGATPDPVGALGAAAPALSSPYRADDIAIVGLAAETPGAASIDELWTLIEAGGNAVTIIPPERWDWQRDYAADPKQAGSSYGRHAGFIRRAKQFDPAFFGIAPVEAARIDPQERRLLEIAYHALEDGGHFGAPCADTGVFVAAMFGHYQNLDAPSGAISASFSSIANRLSYTFDFQGPSLCVDTMCSGSLTALHLAMNALRNGECREALVGAVNIMPHPGKLKLLSKGRFLSPTGRCHSFGAEADGYVPGEGAIVLLIKPLRDALVDGCRIHGVIRGSALNSGGRASGFTVPSARAQEQVIRKALLQAQVDPAQVDYVEAHGTGTSLGDPIEINALDAAYGAHARGRRRVGSIKSNIGHLESAAGLAGLTKILLQFRHGKIAATRNCELVNPYLDLDATAFELPRDTMEWSSPVPRLAGLSSFGAGGSNGHVIVQEYVAAPTVLPSLPHYVLALSGRTPRALAARVEALADWVDRHPEASLYGMGCTLAVYREHFRHRACFVVSNASELRQQLRQFQGQAPVAWPPVAAPALRELVAQYLAGSRSELGELYPLRTCLSLPHYEFEPQEHWDDAIAGKPLSIPPRPSETSVPAAAMDDAPRLVTFEPVWRPAPALEQSHSELPNCLVVCGARQARELQSLSHVTTITPGDEFRIDGRAIQVRAAAVEDWLAAFARLASQDSSACLIDISSAESSDASLARSVAQMRFTMAKAIATGGAGYRLAYLHGDGGEHADLLPGDALMGVVQVLSMEAPDLDLVAVQVDAAALQSPHGLVTIAIEELMAAVAGFSACKRLADGRRWIRGLGEAALAKPSQDAWRTRGVYLISGGMGMIGLGIARRLMAGFSATVVLVGRSPVSVAVEKKLADLRQAGGSAEYASVDITDIGATAALVESILSRHGALHGVIHSAGILKDSLLRTKSWADFDQVWSVKADGARSLDQATRAVALDFFALFSSMSSVFGNVGQADYVAGNRFLDGFARQRQRQVERGERHGRSVSLNWPLWIDDSGADADPMEDYRSLGRYLLDNFGMAPLSIAHGADMLVDLLQRLPTQTCQLMPLLGDRERLVASVGSGQLHRLPGAQGVQTPVQGSPSSAINTTSAARRDAGLVDAQRLALPLRDLVADLSGLAASEIDADRSFGDLGFNSVMLQQLAGQIEDRFGVAMPPSALFNYNSIDRMATYLAATGAEPGDAPGAAVHIALSPPPQGVPAADPRPVGQGDQRIAIIGMDGRLPGGRDLDGFWRLLAENRSAIGPVERWPHGEYVAGTIPDIDHFDARFFGLSAREAMLMDPQHRLFLQSSYNAVLDAGYSPGGLSQVGVFAGVQFSDYQTLLQMSGQESHPYSATGNAHAMLANRVSYLFDFGGPSQTIDTACSSALVAVNRAVMSLQRGECDYAIAGAVSLLIDSAMTRAAQSMGVLSPRHRCATFDAGADGYVRAEGVGCLLLKRYADAVRDGDSIHAIIEACVENHGGRANSLTAPNPLAQQRLLQSAYTPALAARVSYIEAHGTGTKLGDPVEIDALKAAWKSLLPTATTPVHIGSVKTNIGHLEPAAGMASMLKVILAFRHRLLPANLHFQRQNPYIDLDGSPFRILAKNTAWAGEERVAGISSFGFGGTNAHVVLSAPPQALLASSPQEPGAPCLIVLSARSPRSLMAMKDALEQHLQSTTEPAPRLADIAATLAQGRDHFEYRIAWMVRSVAELKSALHGTEADDIRKASRNAIPSAVTDGDVETVREAYLQGVEPAGLGWPAPTDGRRVHLPTYAFDTRAFWFEDVAQAAMADPVATEE